MKIDFSPLQPIMDELLINLLVVVGTPLLVAIILKYILVKMKLPGSLAGSLSSLAFLYLAYKMFMSVIE